LIKFVSSSCFPAKSVEQLRVEQSQFEQFTPTQIIVASIQPMLEKHFVKSF
jgi:hypothetical protein